MWSTEGTINNISVLYLSLLTTQKDICPQFPNPPPTPYSMTLAVTPGGGLEEALYQPT